PGKYAKHKMVNARAARRHDSRDVPIWNKGIFQNGIVAARRAHSEHIPGFLDQIAGAVARHESVHDLWLFGIAGIYSMQAKARPDGSQAAEHFSSREAIAAIDAFCLCSGKKHRDVVPTLGVPGGEYLSCGGFAKNPLQRAIATPPEIGGDTQPIEV